ncbi:MULTISPECIES: glycine-rich domain-containing protein [unclassified Yoonia]|uniref:glycine-rich domain-containing protein n=1 Tax=unclassified Yoonia TaxID=2629118 RepID=UPI002AFF9AE9|nr:MULTISPECIES: PKD domain-containing protein [unclassified Yoonia]
MRWIWAVLTAVVAPLGLLLSLSSPAYATPAACESAYATGGAVSVITINNAQYCVHRFGGNGTFTARREITLDYLVVGGGGGGGGITPGNQPGGGGGGAGGYIAAQGRVLQGESYGVAVGAGGQGAFCGSNFCNPGLNGGESRFGGIIAQGGGHGAYAGQNNGADGGSGGGGRWVWYATGGAGRPGQGNPGAPGPSLYYSGSGGGGAGAAGASDASGRGGNGGAGVSNSITGIPVFYAGGGAGGGYRQPGGSGGIGGGGTAPASIGSGNSGQAGTGGGGGGATGGPTFSGHNGGNGGSGVVIVRYRANTPPSANAGPDVTTVAGTAVTLDGTGSTDAEGNITTYRWTQISGPTAGLTNATTAQPSVTPAALASGFATLVFELTVTDAFGITSRDQVSISVSSPNNPPNYGAGGNEVTQFNDLENNRTLRLHVFRSSGTFNFVGNGPVDYLIVGGGGGGGAFAGGGGGGGGVRAGDTALQTGTFPVTIGAGGSGDARFNWPTSNVPGGDNGQPSSAIGITAQGGGGGGTYNIGNNQWSGRSGGSGGGGSHSAAGGSGTSGQGRDGARGTVGFGTSSGGGGGGAAEVGQPGSTARAGRGGNGVTSDITGTAVVYAGGGAGGGDVRISNGAAPNVGGQGGGGASRNNQAAGENGVNNLGGGGAGGRVDENGLESRGGAGGSGLVILRYVINTGPTGDAGADTVVEAGQPVNLDGTGSTDPDGNISSYRWEQIAGTPVTLTGAETAQASFTATQPLDGPREDLTFRLTVTDAFDLVSVSDVTITLQALAVLVAAKAVAVFSEDGSGCDDLTATPPVLPALPAAIPGACIEYLISVVNEGAATAQDIDLTDLLPEDLTFEAAALGANWQTESQLITPAPGCAGDDCAIRVQDGAIAAGQTATIRIRATIN